MTCVAFSIKFVKLNQKFAENSEFCEKKFTIISELFTSLLRHAEAELAGSADRNDEVRQVLDLEERSRHVHDYLGAPDLHGGDLGPKRPRCERHRESANLGVA